MGPVEASFRERAIEARRRLMGGGMSHVMLTPPVVVAPKAAIEAEQGPTMRTPRRSTMDIVDQVAGKHGVTRADIIGPSRVRAVSQARHEAAYRIVVELGMSLPMVGRVLGARDHTTILNSVRRFVEAHPEAAAKMNAISGYYARVRNQKRLRAIDLYFNDGKSPSEISRSTRASILAVSKWVLDEIERRRALPLSQAELLVSPTFNTPHS